MGIEAFYKEADFNKMFPNRNIGGKAKYKIYEYKYFLAASKKFPNFGTQGSLAMRKREVCFYMLCFSQDIYMLINHMLEINYVNKGYAISHVNCPDSDKLKLSHRLEN